MLDDSFKPEPFERLLKALLELPPLQSSPEAGDGAAQLVLEAIDMALHAPPAWPQRMVAVEYFCKHARHRLGLESMQDLQAFLDQYPQSDDGDGMVAVQRAGLPETPWMDEALYEEWQASGKPSHEFLADIPPFRDQNLKRKPAKRFCSTAWASPRAIGRFKTGASCTATSLYRPG